MKRLLLAGSLCLAACGSEAKPGASSAGSDLLVVGYDREPDTMNRYATHILEDIESCVVEGLVTNDEKMNIVPVLAASIPTVENGGVVLRKDGGMDVTWKLRPGVKWHDGVPHTSADVKFTVDAINKGDWKPESVDGFDRISSVDTPDSLTAVVHYREVYAPYQLQFVRGTLPKHVLDGRSIDAAADYNRKPLGTGPYTVKGVEDGRVHPAGEGPELLARAGVPEDRADSLPLPAEHHHTHQPAEVGGEVQMVVLVPWDKVRELRGLPAVRINQVVGNGYEHVTLNQKHFAPFGELAVRRAMAHAIDRNLIVNTLLDSLVQVVNGPIQPLSPAYEPNVTTYAFDPARAKSILDSAGWIPGADGVRAKNGTRLAFELITQSGFAIRENVSQTLQKQFRDVGIESKVRLIDGTTISSVWFSGNFDAMLHWWQQGADPEITLFFAADRMPPAGRNINYFRDDSLTKMLYESGPDGG